MIFRDFKRSTKIKMISLPLLFFIIEMFVTNFNLLKTLIITTILTIIYTIALLLDSHKMTKSLKFNKKYLDNSNILYIPIDSFYIHESRNRKDYFVEYTI